MGDAHEVSGKERRGRRILAKSAVHAGHGRISGYAQDMTQGKRQRRQRRGRLAACAGGVLAALPHGLRTSILRSLAPVLVRGRARRVLRENLMRPGVLPDSAQPLPLERDVLRHSGRQLSEVLRLSRGANPDEPSWIDEVVQPHASFERLEAELAKGRGAIIVTAHLGNWELLCAWLRRRGLGGAVVGKTRGDDDWLVRVREGYGVRTLGQDAPAKEMLRVLKDGGVLGLLCDLEVRRLDGEFLPFLGLDALTMTAPAALARTMRAPLIPVRCVAIDERRYELSVDEPLELDPSLDRDAARTDLLRRLNDTYSRWIRETPEQWAWHQPRWRTRPGEWDAVPNAEWRRMYG